MKTSLLVTLDRLFSKLGIASRGLSQKWIREGRVQVNHQFCKNPEIWVSWPEDLVTLDGQLIQAPKKRSFIFNKPKGLLTTHQDEKGRKTIFDLLPRDLGFIHAVGRLDKATTGLLLLTNDSLFSSYLTDPTNRVERVYRVTVRGELGETQRVQAMRGVADLGEWLKCESVTIQKRSKRETHLEVTLLEGKNREVRRLFHSLGHEVVRLRRIQFGPFQLETLQPGEFRELSSSECHLDRVKLSLRTRRSETGSLFPKNELKN